MSFRIFCISPCHCLPSYPSAEAGDYLQLYPLAQPVPTAFQVFRPVIVLPPLDVKLRFLHQFTTRKEAEGNPLYPQYLHFAGPILSGTTPIGIPQDETSFVYAITYIIDRFPIFVPHEEDERKLQGYQCLHIQQTSLRLHTQFRCGIADVPNVNVSLLVRATPLGQLCRAGLSLYAMKLHYRHQGSHFRTNPSVGFHKTFTDSVNFVKSHNSIGF